MSNRKATIKELENLLTWVENNEELLLKYDRVNIQIDLVHKMLSEIALERYIKGGGKNLVPVTCGNHVLIVPPNGIFKDDRYEVRANNEEYIPIHIDGDHMTTNEAIGAGYTEFLKYLAKLNNVTGKDDKVIHSYGEDLHAVYVRYVGLLSWYKKEIVTLAEAKIFEEDMKEFLKPMRPAKDGEKHDVLINGHGYVYDYQTDTKPLAPVPEDLDKLDDDEYEAMMSAMAGLIKTDGKTKTIIDGKEVEVKIVDLSDGKEEDDEDPSFNNLEKQVNKEKNFAEEVKNTVAEFAKSPESSLIPEGAKLKAEKKEEKPVSTFGKNGKPTVTLKKAGDKGVLNKKPDFSKATLTASADTPSPIEGIPAMFALNDVAKDAHNLRGGSVRMVKGEDGKMYAEPMKADDMKRINDTIFPKEAYTHNTATGEPLGTPFGDEIMRVFNTSAGEPKVETTPNVVDFTKVDGEEEIVKEDIENLWYIDRANNKLIPFIKKYGKPTYDNNYEAFVLVNPDILFVGNGEVSKMDENSVSNEEEAQLIYDILINIVTNPNKPENDMYSEDFIESATEWVNSIYDDEHAEEIEDDGLDEFRDE